MMKLHSFKFCDSHKPIFKCYEISAKKYNIWFTELDAKTCICLENRERFISQDHMIPRR